MSKSYNVAVVGATGIVGAELLGLLAKRSFPLRSLKLLASPRSAGKRIPFGEQDLEVEALSHDAFEGCDLVFNAIPDETSKEYSPSAVKAGAIVIDKTGAWRMDPDVPLVVPEINPEQARNRPKGIVANANCTTLTMIVAIAPLHREYGLRELVVASYQAVSGSGQLGVDILHSQLAKTAGDRTLGSRSGNVRQAVGDDLGPFPAPIVFNVVPFAGSLREAGWSSEEMKIRGESRKILGLPDLKVSATCVRVPVVTGHSVAVHAVFGTEVEADAARELLRHAPGVIVVDDPASGEFPMPIDAAGTDPAWVGRIRRSLDDPRALDLFITGDNLRKGAALNTAQIAELLVPELTGA